MLLIHKDISHMPITELENDSESIWVKVFANKTSHFVASWYRPPGGDLEKLDSQLKSLQSQLEKIKDIHKGNKPPSQTGSDKNKFITGLKFVSININSIRGKKLELLAFLDFHQP